MKPVVKAPITKRLKLRCDEPLSNFAFELNLRRFNLESNSIEELDGLLHLEHLRCLYIGKAVQVVPIKPTLKAPGTKRLKLKCDRLLSTLAFKFNLRRYTSARTACTPSTASHVSTRSPRWTSAITR